MILCHESSPLDCRMLSGISGLYSEGCPRTPPPIPPSCDNDKCFQTFLMSPGGGGGGSSTQTGLVEKHCKRIGWFVIRSPAHRQHAPRGQGLVCILNTHAWHIIRDQYATVKSLQSRPTLCDPIDGSPPGSSVPGFSRQEYWSGLPFPSPKWGQQNLITHDKTAHWPTLWYKINATSTFHGVSWWPAIQTLRF